MSCINCNRPCIRNPGGEGCQIANMRIKYGITFKDAWERLTNCNYDNPPIPVFKERLEPLPWANVMPEIDYKDIAINI